MDATGGSIRFGSLSRGALALLIVCTLAACSSDKSKSVPTTTTPPPTTQVPSTTANLASKAFCAAASAAITDEHSIDLEDGTSAVVKAAAAKTIVDVIAAQKVAPADFSEEWDDLVAGLQEYQQVLADNNYDIAAFKASPEGAALLNDSELAQTFTDIDEYLATKCGVTP